MPMSGHCVSVYLYALPLLCQRRRRASTQPCHSHWGRAGRLLCASDICASYTDERTLNSGYVRSNPQNTKPWPFEACLTCQAPVRCESSRLNGHVRDATFGEDASANRTSSGPTNLATIRAAVIAALKDVGYLHVSEGRVTIHYRRYPPPPPPRLGQKRRSRELVGPLVLKVRCTAESGAGQVIEPVVG